MLSNPPKCHIWKNSKENGVGKFVGVNGTTYEGSWLEGKYHGFGKITTPDGKTLEGQFKYGRYVKEKD